MDFHNLTPFDAMCYSALDLQDRKHCVVAMKVGYRLQPVPGLSGRFLAQVIDDEPMALRMDDEYYGAPGETSLREESDIAPYKPRCDVIVRGHAHAPGAAPRRRWDVRIRLSMPVRGVESAPQAPRPLNPGMALTERQQKQWREVQSQAQRQRESAPERRCLLDKTLRVTGPRDFRRDWRRLWRGWRLTGPTPALAVPLRWEYAFGGSSVVPNPAYPSRADVAEFLLNEVCYSNPLGHGWVEKRYAKAARKGKLRTPRRLPAPQFEYPDAPVAQLRRVRHPAGATDAARMAYIAGGYGAIPAGFGAVDRPWAPRIALAGTPDQHWLESRWPYLPEDFDFGYWNGAPNDQQIDYPPPDMSIELWNLVGADADVDGRATIEFPGHRPFALLRLHGGALFPVPMLTDTVIVDTDAMTVSLTHRLQVPADAPIRLLEARIETDPSAPLLKFEEDDGSAAATSRPTELEEA